MTRTSRDLLTSIPPLQSIASATKYMIIPHGVSRSPNHSHPQTSRLLPAPPRHPSRLAGPSPAPCPVLPPPPAQDPRLNSQQTHIYAPGPPAELVVHLPLAAHHYARPLQRRRNLRPHRRPITASTVPAITAGATVSRFLPISTQPEGVQFASTGMKNQLLVIVDAHRWQSLFGTAYLITYGFAWAAERRIHPSGSGNNKEWTAQTRPWTYILVNGDALREEAIAAASGEAYFDEFDAVQEEQWWRRFWRWRRRAAAGGGA
ncbi:Uu.00g114800.m01.CDS01 [Anthostomella pinea]|uniref:Uu.00g114800.m01.CDS01 n=1 Tax=Anthostomella pinea TaxID=933095 RepID=A0AAI8VG87_9PEZI|nr:Uu.00g114800.m01.CDS01 [Anthostomella pinea]